MRSRFTRRGSAGGGRLGGSCLLRWRAGTSLSRLRGRRRIALDRALAPSMMKSRGTAGSSPRSTRLPVESPPRAYRLKAGNAASPISTSSGTIPRPSAAYRKGLKLLAIPANDPAVSWPPSNKVTTLGEVTARPRRAETNEMPRFVHERNAGQWTRHCHQLRRRCRL